MENKLEIFKNQEFGEIRVLSINNEPYFVAKDVCKILEIKNTTQAIGRLDDDERAMLNIGRQGDVNVVNEYGLFNLILASRKKEAQQFKKWITHEVLPSIRKTGGYIYGEEHMDEEQLIATAIKVMDNKIKKLQLENSQQQQMIGELKPKADYTDKILQSKSIVPITAIAKDYGMSGQAMNDKLHELGIQYKMGTQWLLYSKYQDKGYTHSETISIAHKDGSSGTKMNTKWTQKGRLFLYELLKTNGILPMIEREA